MLPDPVTGRGRCNVPRSGEAEQPVWEFPRKSDGSRLVGRHLVVLQRPRPTGDTGEGRLGLQFGPLSGRRFGCRGGAVRLATFLRKAQGGLPLFYRGCVRLLLVRRVRLRLEDVPSRSAGPAVLGWAAHIGLRERNAENDPGERLGEPFCLGSPILLIPS